MADTTSVVVEMTASDAQLVAAWQRARKGPEEMERAIKRIKTSSDDSVGSLQQIGAAFTGINSLIDVAVKGVGLFKTELDDALARAKEIGGVQVGLAGSQRKAFEANGPGSDINNKELGDLVLKQKNIPLEDIYAALEGGLKEAGGNFSHREAANTAIETAKLNIGLGGGELREIAGNAVDLQRQTGVTGRQAAALIKSAARNSESSQVDVAKSLVPYLGRARTLFPQASLEDLSQLATSIEGTQNEGITNATAAAEKLLVKSHQAGVRGNIDEVIAGARARPLIRASFRGSAYTAINDLLDPYSETGQAFANRERADNPADVLKREQAFANEVNRQPGQIADRINRRSKNTKARLASLATEEGIAAEATNEAMEALKTSGVGATRRAVTSAARGFAYQTQDTETYLQSTAGLVNQRASEVAAGGNQESAQVLRETRDGILAMIEEVRLLRAGKLDVNVRGVPADSRPQASPARALSD